MTDPNQAYRLVKRAEGGAGRIIGYRAAWGGAEIWADPHQRAEAVILDLETAEDAAQTWNDYAATKGYGWRVIAEPA